MNARTSALAQALNREGQTWGNDVFVSNMPGGWNFDVSGIYRCNGLPITMCDISNSPYRGNVYVVWSDQRNGVTDTDIFMAKSTNAGNTWSAPIKVNDDNTARHQFFVWSTIDLSTGHLWFVFYDRRNTTGSATDVLVAKPTEGGTTFENFKVSESSFTPTSGTFFGDYTNIAAWNGKIYPIWMRLQSGQLSVWIVKIQDIIPVELNNFTADVKQGKVYLSWETATELNNLGFFIERRNISSEEDGAEWIEIGFKEGKGNSTERNLYRFEDHPLYDGTYHYRLRQVDYDGSFAYSNEIEVNIFTVKTFELVRGAGYAYRCDGTVPAGFAATADDCNDANAAVHPGAPEVCNGLDDDCSTSVDDVAIPSGPLLVGASRDGDTLHLSWGTVEFATGYDVVKGDLATLRSTAGDFTVSTTSCLANDTTALTQDDPEVLASEQTRWYLVRPSNCSGAGSYEDDGNAASGIRDESITASPSACP